MGKKPTKYKRLKVLVMWQGQVINFDKHLQTQSTYLRNLLFIANKIN